MDTVKNSTAPRSRRQQDRISEEEKLAMEALARDAAGDPQPRRFLTPSEMIGMMGNLQSDTDPGELQPPNEHFRMNYNSSGAVTPYNKEKLDEFTANLDYRNRRRNPELYEEIDPRLPLDPESRMIAEERLREAFKARRVKGVPM